jgi:CRP/FNR family cyclic AMP-dependent transcriptional regulator
MSSANHKSADGASSEYQENLDIIRQVDFFSALPLEAQKMLAYLSVRDRFDAGDLLFRQGDDDGLAFYLIKGNCRLVREAGATGAESVIRQFGAGKFIGGLSLMASLRRVYSLKAVDTVTSLTLQRDKFGRVMIQFPDLWPKIIQALADRIRGWEEHIWTVDLSDKKACRDQVGVCLI